MQTILEFVAMFILDKCDGLILVTNIGRRYPVDKLPDDLLIRYSRRVNKDGKFGELNAIVQGEIQNRILEKLNKLSVSFHANDPSI